MLQGLVRPVAVAALAMVVLVATGCGGDEKAPESGVVEWGWMFELSGVLGPFGEPTGDGVKMAVKEINEAGGFQVPDGGRNDYAGRVVTPEDVMRKEAGGGTTYTIRLIEHDTRTDTNQTVAIATQLIRDDKVKVIWGPASQGEPEATALTQPEQVLHICACQQREQTALKTEEQAQNESHWAFQTLPALSVLFPSGARDVREQFPEYQTFGILCSNDQVGKNVCDSLVDGYQQAGFDLVGREDFPPDTTDYRPFLTSIKSRDPDILLNYVDPISQGGLLKQALELQVGRYFGAVALPANLVETLAGPGIRELPVGVGGYPRQQVQPTSEEVRQYFEKYAAFKGGTLPLVPFVSLLQYDFVYMLVAAMQQAGTVEDTTAIADALETIHYHGVGEDDIYFNERHLGIMGSDGCTLFQGDLSCEHTPPEKIFGTRESQ